MSIYREWEFAKNVENAERLLELKLFGWTFRAIQNIGCPFSIDNVVQNMVTRLKVPLSTFATTKPTPIAYNEEGRPVYDSTIALQMHKLSKSGLYSELRLDMANQWERSHGVQS